MCSVECARHIPRRLDFKPFARNFFGLISHSYLLCLNEILLLILARYDRLSCYSLSSEVCGSCHNRRVQKKDGRSKVKELSSIPMTSACFPPPDV